MPKKDAATEVFTSDDATIVETEEVEESLELSEPEDAFGNIPESVEDKLINDVLSFEVTPDDIRERQSALYLETGNYRWIRNQNFKVSVTFSDKDIKSTDLAQKRGIKGTGRCFIKVSGAVENEEGRKGSFEFTASPDIRSMPNGKLDFMTNAFEMATKLFFAKEERNYRSTQEIVDMLMEAKYSMYITFGNGRNFLNKLNNL
jgi:hypothetical protein